MNPSAACSSAAPSIMEKKLTSIRKVKVQGPLFPHTYPFHLHASREGGRIFRV